MRFTVRLSSVAAFLVAALFIVPAGAEAPAGASADPAVRLGGNWTGAKLRCLKEEKKLVRCGTPSFFEITFLDSGTGTTPDENLPKEFFWRWTGPKEIVISSKEGGKEIKIFAIEHEDEGLLTFQAYVYLPAADPKAPAEVRYIHYVFDVSRTQ